MSLVSSEELKRTFCVTKYYGENDGRTWPRSTTRLVKCKVLNRRSPNSECNRQSLEWECITGTDRECDNWIRFNNTIVGTFRKTKVHAETHMRNYLYEKIDKKKAKKVDICIYINYSPCDKCASVITNMMDEFKNEKIEVTIKIVFANFYKCHGNSKIDKSNREGLVNLLQKGVSLNVFADEVWNDLLHEVLKLVQSRTFKHVIQDENTIGKRNQREIIDKKCLECLLEKSRMPNPYIETDEEKERLREVFEKNDKNFIKRNRATANANYETHVISKGDEYIKCMEQKRQALERKRKHLVEKKRQALEE